MRFERWKKAEEAVARKTQREVFCRDSFGPSEILVCKEKKPNNVQRRFTLLSLIDLQLRDNILKGIGDFDKGISGARDSVRGYYSGGEE